MGLIDQMEYAQANGAGLPFEDGGSRSSGIMRASIVGIAVNAALVVMKVVVGLITNSVAIVSDAINNLADTLGGILTIIGTKLASKRPDRKHPFGYGRTEYVFTVIVGGLILFSGANALNESIRHIIHPEPTSYSAVSIIVLVIAMVGRFGIGMYQKKKGRALESDSMVASGTDAVLDSVVTAATIVSAIITILFGISTEAYLAVIISLLILKAGLEVFQQAISKILGQRASDKISEEVIATVESVPGVLDAINLRLVDYGPENIRGSVYVEVDEHISASDADEIARAAKIKAFVNCHVRLDAVGIQPVSTDAETRALRNEVEEMVLENEHVLEMNSFRLNKETRVASLDVVVDFERFDREALADQIAEEAAHRFAGYRFIVTTATSVTG